MSFSTQGSELGMAYDKSSDLRDGAGLQMFEPTHVCSPCGARLPPSRSCQDLCDELFAYTLTRERGEFIHQHAVDAYAAQHVGKDTKPVKIAGSLIGLYLFAERGYTGRQVQLAHMALGNKMKSWPQFEAPEKQARLTVSDPLNVPPGPERDEIIRQWARDVWEMWRESHAQVERVLNEMWGTERG
jgi:hypothetical protein